MIIIKSWTEGIKFECHKKESLIIHNSWRTKRRAKPHIFLIFYSITFYYNECLLFIRHDLKIENIKNVLNNKTLNKSWFGLKLTDPK